MGHARDVGRLVWASHAISAATSRASPACPSGTSIFDGGWSSCPVIRVAICPGATALTRIPCSPSLSAITFVSPPSPCFEAVYRADPDSGRRTRKARRGGLFISSGGGIRTRDLRVMSPTSYLTAPPRGVAPIIATETRSLTAQSRRSNAWTQTAPWYRGWSRFRSHAGSVSLPSARSPPYRGSGKEVHCLVPLARPAPTGNEWLPSSGSRPRWRSASRYETTARPREPAATSKRLSPCGLPTSRSTRDSAGSRGSIATRNRSAP